jgi:hypothetical protein
MLRSIRRIAARPARRRAIGILAAGLTAVVAGGLGWQALAVAQPSPPRVTASATSHEAPDVYYGRIRAELARSTTPGATIESLVARARQAPPVGPGDLTACPPVPPGGATVTSNGFYFLSQILPPGIGLASPACGQALACFLGKIVAHQVDPSNPPSDYSDATLVIDRQCVVSQTLVVPDRFVLAGVGTEGRGVLAFDLPDNTVALRFAASAGSPQRFTTLRDLNIVNVAQCCGQVGVNVANSSFVTLERVRVHDFGFGVLGGHAFSILIDKSLVHNNGFNIVIDSGATAWRVRDTTISQSGILGLSLATTAIGNFVSGGRLESNPFTAIYTLGPQNVIEASWFEGNGIGFGDHGIRVGSSADQTRILGNLFSSEDIYDQGSNTQICFNTDDNAMADLNTCPH